MTINNLQAHFESLTDWAMLDGCFPGLVRPTDIDGCVERNGVTLFIEHKKPGASIGRGQMILFQALARQGNTVLVFWGVRLDVEALQVIGPRGVSAVQDAGLDALREIVKQWWQAANAGTHAVTPRLLTETREQLQAVTAERDKLDDRLADLRAAILRDRD